MLADTNPLDLRILVDSDQEIDDEWLSEQTYELKSEMIELPFVEQPQSVQAGVAPQGAKAVEVITLGALAIAVLPAVLPKLIEFLRDWSQRGQNRVVKIEMQAGGRTLKVEVPQSMTQDELKRYVDTLTGALSDRLPAEAG